MAYLHDDERAALAKLDPDAVLASLSAIQRRLRDAQSV